MCTLWSSNRPECQVYHSKKVASFWPSDAAPLERIIVFSVLSWSTNEIVTFSLINSPPPGNQLTEGNLQFMGLSEASLLTWKKRKKDKDWTKRKKIGQKNYLHFLKMAKANFDMHLLILEDEAKFSELDAVPFFYRKTWLYLKFKSSHFHYFALNWSLRNWKKLKKAESQSITATLLSAT